MVLTSDIGTGMTIGELARMYQYSSDVTASYLDLNINMGQCTSDQLGTDSMDNYIPGTRTLFYHADTMSLDVKAGEWFSVTMDTPYEFTGEENLLIEITHDPGSGGLYGWSWTAGPSRSISTYSPGPTSPGYPSSLVPYMTLSGPDGLHCVTFGAIKSLPGGH